MLTALPLVLLLGLAAPQDVDLLVRNGTVVTMDAGRSVIRNGAVAVERGAILAVGPESELSARYRGKQTLDARQGLVMPGLINAHGHAPMVLFRGLADDLRLMDWLQQYIFPAEARNVTPEFVLAGTRLAALEMIRSGTTTFVDMYFFGDQVAEGARQAGLRAVVGQPFVDFPAPDNKSFPEALLYAQRFFERWSGDALIVPAAAPHSVYLCSPEHLQAVGALAARFSAPLVIHVSESADEQAQVRARYGKTPTEHLRDLGLLRKGVVFAHGTWLSASDRAIVKAADVGVVHCPQSNMKLASGAAPLRELLAEGLRVGLGTDGAASNNDLDMFEELLTASLLAKHVSGDATVAPASAVLELATLGGARALGLEHRLGSLEPGKRADLVVVGLEAPRLHPLYDPISQLVYATKGADVRDVVVEGRIIMRDRQVLTLNEAAVLAEADRLRAQVLERLAAPR